ncbi:MAG: 50S ribosomal protein L6 [Desulfosudis oleivorans]|nr:50S ribosomal protein L6 [Desulfosudis oleivorans]
MSRIGKKPITFPKNVKISQSADIVKVEGPKGILSTKLPEGIALTIGDGSHGCREKIRRIICTVLSWFSQNLNRKHGKWRQHWF